MFVVVFSLEVGQVSPKILSANIGSLICKTGIKGDPRGQGLF